MAYVHQIGITPVDVPSESFEIDKAIFIDALQRLVEVHGVGVEIRVHDDEKSPYAQGPNTIFETSISSKSTSS